MQFDFLITGQGICGSLLSWQLIQAGRTVLVIDDAAPFSSSRVASGLINPVTGKRYVRSWMIDELLPIADGFYAELEKEWDLSLVQHTSILEFHTGRDTRDAFAEKLTEDKAYLSNINDEATWQNYFYAHYGIGVIDSCRLIDLNILLQKQRTALRSNNALLEEKFDWKDCIVTHDGIQYKDIKAGKIICCEGVAGFQNPYFSMLPYTQNKGEVIIASIPGLPRDAVYKQGIKIIPWKEDLFWTGASFEWKYEDILPTESYRQYVEDRLKNWLKLPFTIVDHWASERPTTMEYRPFVGFHPSYPNIGIMNGMGTKACSLAPFCTEQMVNHILQQTPIMPEINVQRHDRLLRR